MEVRTTVLSVEQERELLKIALEEEKNTVGVCSNAMCNHTTGYFGGGIRK